MSGPIPARVDEAAKAKLLAIIEAATDSGWSLARACGVLELDRRRFWRWQGRAAVGALAVSRHRIPCSLSFPSRNSLIRRHGIP